jgi:predicted Zn-dependent protease with MMP-like domain
MSLETEFHAAVRLLAEGDARAAAEHLRAVVSRGDLPPAFEAETRYLLGRALGECGDRDGRAREWSLVPRLDAAAARPRRLLTPEEFEAIAQAALDELPQELLDELRGVGIMIEDRPTPLMVADGMDPRILGVYHGVPLSRRSVSFGAPYADTIHLFSANLERVCATRSDLARQIRVTVLHETAHFFGYSEGQLRSMGLA